LQFGNHLTLSGRMRSRFEVEEAFDPNSGEMNWAGISGRV